MIYYADSFLMFQIDSFTYTATDALGTPTNTATVSIYYYYLAPLGDGGY